MEVGTKLMLKSELNYLVDFIIGLLLLTLKNEFTSLSQEEETNTEVKEFHQHESNSTSLNQWGPETLLGEPFLEVLPAHSSDWSPFSLLPCPPHCQIECLVLR